QSLYILVRCRTCLVLSHPATSSSSALSLHDALPISARCASGRGSSRACPAHRWKCPPRASIGSGSRARTRPTPVARAHAASPSSDRKSTRLNSSHVKISYAVFCLKKKNKLNNDEQLM